MIRRALVTLSLSLGVGLAVVAAPVVTVTDHQPAAVASARPVQDTAVECEAGYRRQGARCVQRIVPKEQGGTVGEWAIAVLGVGVLIVLA